MSQYYASGKFFQKIFNDMGKGSRFVILKGQGSKLYTPHYNLNIFFKVLYVLKDWNILMILILSDYGSFLFFLYSFIHF